jgi:hypothetical protein
MLKRFFCNPKVIALLMLASVVAWVHIWQGDHSIPVGKNAVIITGECIVINYDATEAEFDAAKAAWLEALKEHPAENTGHTKAYY